MVEPDLTFPDQPRGELDRRLADLVDAANEVLATQGRLRSLLRATQTITQQLDLDGVLRSVVDAARELTGAQYAALGVIGEHGDLERFVHAGMDPADVERIGHLPRGKGLLGALITDPRPIRVPDIAADARSSGFPAGHPPMRDFLGVPVPVRDTVYGNLYLSGSPAGAFSDEDEQLLRSLASTAGFAVENARLYRETRRRQEWATASAEITARLLSPHEGGALPLIAARTREVARAMSTFVVLVSAEDPEQVEILDVDGRDPNAVHGSTRPLTDTIAERAIRDGSACRYEEVDVRAFERPELDAFGPVMVLPLGSQTRAIGALIIARAPGADTFTDVEALAASDFAGRAGVAMELARTREQAQRVLLFEERGRIARDLHDRVIQQLFATGMQLQGVLGTLPPGRDADRVDAAVASLDDSITQIRRVIFTLQATGNEQHRMTGRQRLFQLIERQSAAFGIEPSVSVAGPVDGLLDGDLAEDLLAVVEEGVANAVKHASAKDIAVAVRADGRGITATVSNDGEPFADSGRRSGLGNLEQRALRRQGSMRLEAIGGRTVMTWAVPLRPAVLTGT